MCSQLPDYHDVIEHPMDFGTIRKKLDKGEYANLEQFEVCIETCSELCIYVIYSFFFWHGSMQLCYNLLFFSVTSKSVGFEI
jgi:Bromodomain